MKIIALLALILILSGCAERADQDAAFQPDLPHFTDVTDESGIDFQHGAFRWDVSGDPVAMMGGGLCWLDFDNDGWLDLYVVNNYAEAEAGRWQTEMGGLPTSVLYHNQNGSFTDVSEKAGVAISMRGNGCVAADFDLDGYTDLYITTARVNLLLWNNGDGTFTEGANDAGVDAYGWQTAAVVGDVNKDGWPDLFVAGYVDLNNKIPESTMGFPNTNYGVRDLMYLSNGTDANGAVTFREIGEIAGLEKANFEYGLGALFSDVDNDGDLDLFVANDTNPNRLYENFLWPGGAENDPEGIGFRFAEVGSTARINDRNSGMGVASADYNNDGGFDLVITNMGPQYHSVYSNNPSGDAVSFTDASHLIGVEDIGVGSTGWGISWADIDLDTDSDLVITNGSIPVVNPATDVQRLQLFCNLTAQGLTGLFQDLTDLSGFTDINPLIGRGSAMADYDNDGDPDLVVNSIAGSLTLLRNENQSGNWLGVDLNGIYPGTVVHAELANGQVLTRELHVGSSYLSSEDPRIFFGLGNARRVVRLTVQWPDGNQTTMNNVRAGRIVSVSKPATTPEQLFGSSGNVDMSDTDMDTFLSELALQQGGAAPLTVIPPESDELVALGEALFWDRILSGNRDISCATCHHPVAMTGDNLSVSFGTGGHGLAASRELGEGRELIPRNATELFNRGAVGWTTMFWDVRVSGTVANGFSTPAGAALPDDFENIMAAQAMFPVTSRDEMRGLRGDRDVFGNRNEIAAFADDDLTMIWAALMDRLLEIDDYQAMFEAAYPDVPQQWLGFQHAANAIAAYEMATFTYMDSPWDQYLLGDANALSDQEKRGMALFYGEAGCSQCHNGPLLTDQAPHNIGVPQIGPGKAEDIPLDTGRGRLTHAPGDAYRFRTPPLRNVAVTGPWMHNGAYATLEAAVRHHLDPVTAYENYDLDQLTPLMQDTYHPEAPVLATLDRLVSTPIDLTDAEVDDLLAFLHALTSPQSLDFCQLIPESVPSGLPVDRDNEGICP